MNHPTAAFQDLLAETISISNRSRRMITRAITLNATQEPAWSIRINDPYEAFATKYGDLMKDINFMPLLWWNTEDPTGFVDSYIDAPYPPKVIEVLFGEDRTDLLDHVERIKSRGIGIMMNPIYPHLVAGRLDDLALSNPDDNWGWVIESGATVIGTDRPVLLMDYLEDSNNRGF